MDDLTLIPQRADVSQHGAARGADLIGQRLDCGCPVTAEHTDDGVLSDATVHDLTLARMVTNFGTISHYSPSGNAKTGDLHDGTKRREPLGMVNQAGLQSG